MGRKKRSLSPPKEDFPMNTLSEIVQAASSAVLLPEISKFTGEGSSSEAKEWLRSVENQGLIGGWNNLQKLETAKRLLIKAAKNWYLLNADDIGSWTDFRKCFYETFIGEDDGNIVDKWERFSTRVQRDKETPIEYIFEKLRLAKDVGAPLVDSKNAVCNGLKSTEMAKFLRVYDYQKTADWTKRVREFEASKPKTLPLTSTSKPWNASTNDASSSSSASGSSSTNNATSNEKTNDKTSTGKINCFNCKQMTDHISRNCPLPQRPKICVLCKAEGHRQKDCPTKPKAETPDKEKNVTAAASTSLSTKSGDKYIKTAYINDFKVKNCMIDPGSKVCIVQASTVILCNVKIEKSDTRIFGVGKLDSGTEVIGTFRASVSVDNVKVENIEILVVPDSIIPAPFLIGQSYTESPTVTFLKVRDKLIIRNIESPFCEFPSIDDLKRDKVRLENIKSDKNIVNFVRVDSGAVVAHFDDNLFDQRKDQSDDVRDESFTCATTETSTNWRPLTYEDVNFGEVLSTAEREKFLHLLNKYRKCFALNIFELGKAKIPPIEIETIPGSVPPAAKPYRTNAADAAEMTRQINEWRAAGIVVDTSSPYAAPGFLVGKKNGTKRPVFDYRRLNAITIKSHFPIPNADDHLSVLSDATLFSLFDLAFGYFQMPLSKEAQKKTAFITPNESGEFTVYPFGPTNGPFEFAKMMKTALGKLSGKIAFNFFDDVFVPAKSVEQMLQRVEEVLKAFEKYNLACRPEKCFFAVTKIEFLGFEISSGEMRPGIMKIEAIKSFPVPTNVHEVRRFIGLAGFFRRFIKNFAIKIAPLTDLTKKNATFEWTKRENDAFINLRDLLTQRPILRLFDPNAITELHTDASKHGIAGLLLQKSRPDAPLQLVYAVSKKTTEPESLYHSSKLELLAIVWSISKLRQFLLSIPFTVVTDCQALLHLNANKSTNPQIARWSLALQEYDFKVHHRKGENMQHADALSRAPVDPATDTESAVHQLGVFQVLSEEDIIRMYQRRDLQLRTIVNNVDKYPEYELRDGLLYYKDRETQRSLFVVPKTMRKSLCIRYHDLLGHYSVEKVIASIKKSYWFAGMRKYVRVHIRSCIDCLLTKDQSGKAQGLLNPIPTGKRPFEVVHVDHIGPFSETSSGNNHVFVLVDNFTKFVRLWPVISTGTNEVEVCLRDFIMSYGIPDKIISDRGPCFTSTNYENFCKQRGIVAHRVAVRHPRANGQCERVNRVLNAQMTIYAASSSEEIEDWDRFISEIERNINVSVNRSTGKAPFELLHGYVPRYNESTLHRIIKSAEVNEDLDVMRHVAEEHIRKSQAKMKAEFDRRHCVGDKLIAGEIVFIKCAATAKLQPKYRGPMVVVQNVAGDIYRVQDLRREGTQHGLVDLHISQIRPWKASWKDEFDSDEDTNDAEDSISGRTAE